MRNYETVCVLHPTLSEEETKGKIEKFKSLVEQNQGQVEGIEEWGKKKLAYEINDLKEGYYVLMNFSAEPSFVGELERSYKLTDGVLRYLVIKKD